MAEQQQIQIQMDPTGYYLSAVNISVNEEAIVFFLASQNQGRQYITSPKHAKRISLLLQKIIGEYESKYGKLETELPKIPDQTNESKTVGFDANK